MVPYPLPAVTCPHTPAPGVTAIGMHGEGSFFSSTTIWNFHFALLSPPFQAHTQPLPRVSYRLQGKCPSPPPLPAGDNFGSNVAKVLVGITRTGHSWGL